MPPLQNGLDGISHQFFHLRGASADITLGVQFRIDFLFCQRECGVVHNALNQVVGAAFQFHFCCCPMGMGAQTFVKFLSVAAFFHRLHQNVFCCHKRQFFHDTAVYNLIIDHNAAGHVDIDI